MSTLCPNPTNAGTDATSSRSACYRLFLRSRRAHDAGGFEALLVRDGTVTEGSSTNAFCVRDGVLWTHPCGPRILPGVTRTAVLEGAAKAAIPVREDAVTLEQFARADEAFICSTTMTIMPVTKLDGKPVGNGKLGPVTRQLMKVVNGLLEDDLRSATLFL